jgi:hypothetical protein
MSYQAYFKEALAAKDRADALTFNIDANIAMLDTALGAYSANQSQGNLSAVTTAFAPIAEYYSRLTEVTTNLQMYLDKASKYVADSQYRLVNEERYDDRVHPEESTKSREIMFGILPSLRVRSIPYILTAGVFMSLLTLFLIFQMLGLSGQLNLPPALVQWWKTPAVGPPFYKDPMVLGGGVVVFIATTIIFAFMYFRQRDI